MATAAGERTRTRILDTAQALILEQGYAATSVDQIIAKLEMTKGTFFYHFKKKDDLALALIRRYAKADAELLEKNLSRAEKLGRDPLQRVLIFVGLFLEMAEGLEESPSCLFASYCYESGLFDASIHEVVAGAMLVWRKRFGDLLRSAAEERAPRARVDIDALADMITVVFEGAFILSRTLKEPSIFAAQLRLYRSYLELLFAEPQAAPRGASGSGRTERLRKD